MMRDLQVATGDICGDPTGLRVKVEDVDIYDYVHFSVIEGGEEDEEDEDEAESGEMSHVAFVHRFTKFGNSLADKTTVSRMLHQRDELTRAREIL
jgi:hypothetical protein